MNMKIIDLDNKYNKLLETYKGMSIENRPKFGEKIINLAGEIQMLSEIQESINGKKFREGILFDNTSQIKFTLWDEEVEKYKLGDKIIFSVGWCKEFKNELQVSSGKFGKSMKIPESKEMN